MLRRIISGSVLLAMVAVTFTYLPDAWGWVVILPLAMLGQAESLHLLDGAGLRPFPRMSLAMGGLMVVAHWVALLRAPTLAPHIPGLVLALALGASGVLQIRERSGFSVHRMAGTLLAVLYAPFLMTFFSTLVLWEGGQGRWLLLFMILVVKCTDIGAYFTGRCCGRHLFAPSVSPKKTWEGCAGGVLTGLVVGLGVWWLAGEARLGLRAADAAALGLVLPMVGILGDLLESQVKRAGQVKDSGASIRGLGGWLDVLDSLLLAAPVVVAYALVMLNR